MTIRWDEFPHSEICLRIYARLDRNHVSRSAEDADRHILRRRLASLDAEDHKRFVELEARTLVEHLRCTRDVYQEFVDSKGCRPVLEAHWVVLRCAVFPTAIAILRKSVVEYASLSQVPLAALSFLFGILTRICYEDVGDGVRLLRCPDLADKTIASSEELQLLGRRVDEDTLLWFRDIRDGYAVGHPVGLGPFSLDDVRAIHNSFNICGLTTGMVFPEWRTVQEEPWRLHKPWTSGLCSLFGLVQDELKSQWRALRTDSRMCELQLKEQASTLRSIVIPLKSKKPRLNNRRPGPTPRLPDAFVVCAGTQWRKALSNSKTKVSDDQLRQIALELDAAGHGKPSDCLEGKYGQDLRSFNSRNSNSKIRPIMTWSELVSRGDKDLVRGMRRLLSRCARKLDDPRLSGN